MTNHLGIGFGTEDMTTLFKFPPKFEEIFDYSVVNYGDLFIAVCVGMSINLGGRSVSGPSCVTYPDSTGNIV